MQDARDRPLPTNIDLQLTGSVDAIDRDIPPGFAGLDELQISTLLVQSLQIGGEKQADVIAILLSRIHACPHPQKLTKGLLSAPLRVFLEVFVDAHGADHFGKTLGPDGLPSCPLRLLHPSRIAPSSIYYVFGLLHPYVTTEAPGCLEAFYRACVRYDDAETLVALTKLYELPATAFTQAVMKLRPWSDGGHRLRRWAAALLDQTLCRQPLDFDSKMLIGFSGGELTPWLLAAALARSPAASARLATELQAIPSESTWPGRLKIALSNQHGRLALHARLSGQATEAILNMKIHEVCALLSGRNTAHA